MRAGKKPQHSNDPRCVHWRRDRWCQRCGHRALGL